MELKKVRILNYKSINKLDIELKKYGNSYTVAFVGINEVGKTNILKAMSLLDTPTGEYFFSELNNQNNIDEEYVDVYFDMILKNKDEYLKILKEKLECSDELSNQLQINLVSKNVYLNNENNKFLIKYFVDLNKLNYDALYFKEINEETAENYKLIIKDQQELPELEVGEFKKLEEKILSQKIATILTGYFKKFETKVISWEPTAENLITTSIDLNQFKDKPSINVPLRNIFYLTGYKTVGEIKQKIENCVKSRSSLRGLESNLAKYATKYLNEVWSENDIKIDVRISDQLKCDVFVQDTGTENELKFYPMNFRSDGFKQFVSLILTLSIENKDSRIKNKLILIDEPELHLHPSGIRYMREELIKIGCNNYLFFSTHSNFMIDNKTIERNVIVKKDRSKNTYLKYITDMQDGTDDEVLKDAFGINVFKDFLTSHKILVEGKSDKNILLKAIKKAKPNFDFAITNGMGNNIVAIASLLNFQDVPAIVILDDDEKGNLNKQKIIQIGGAFSDKSVFTIRDITGELIAGATIEDALSLEYIQKEYDLQFKKSFESNNNHKLVLDSPVIEQIKKELLIKGNDVKIVEKFIFELKIRISEDYHPSNISVSDPQLNKLITGIIKILDE